MRQGIVLLTGLFVILAAVGCGGPAERLNAPPQGSTNYPSSMQDSFVCMVDNAMLEDLSMADIHFVPHSTELNGLGARRLERYAKLLTVYGGSIRYSTNSSDKELIDGRMASIRDYLGTTQIAMDRIKVVQGLPGGHGVTAREAITVKAETIPGSPQAQTGGGAGAPKGGAGAGPAGGLSSMFGALLGGGK